MPLHRDESVHRIDESVIDALNYASPNNTGISCIKSWRLSLIHHFH